MDERTFLDLIRENQGIIYKVVSLYAADPEEKKDLYQEILLQCWKGITGFRGDARFSTWLYRISLNTVLTSRRKKSKIRYTDNLPESNAEQPVVFEEENAIALQQAIRMLSDVDRAIALLHLEGYSNGEIATMMGISTGHLTVKLYRIRQQLTKILNSTAHG